MSSKKILSITLLMLIIFIQPPNLLGVKAISSHDKDKKLNQFLDDAVPITLGQELDYFTISGDIIVRGDIITTSGDILSVAPDWSPIPDVAGWVVTSPSGVSNFYTMDVSGGAWYGVRSVSKNEKALVVWHGDTYSGYSDIKIYEYSLSSNSFTLLFNYDDPNYDSEWMDKIDANNTLILLSGTVITGGSTPYQGGKMLPAVYAFDYNGNLLWKYIFNNKEGVSYAVIYKNKIYIGTMIFGTPYRYVELYEVKVKNNIPSLNLLLNSTTLLGFNNDVYLGPLVDLNGSESTLLLGKKGDNKIYILNPIDNSLKSYSVDNTIQFIFNKQNSKLGNKYLVGYVDIYDRTHLLDLTGNEIDISLDRCEFVIFNQNTIIVSSYVSGTGHVKIYSYTSSAPTKTKSSILFEKIWGGSGNDRGFCVIGVDNYLYIGGRTSSFSGNDDTLLMKYDLSGNLIWNKTWGRDRYDVIVDVYSNGSHILAVGHTESFGNPDVLLLIYDSNGSLLKYLTWGGSADDRGKSVLIVDNYIYVAGITRSYTKGDYDIVLLKYDLSGNLIWYKTWGGSLWDESFKLLYINNSLFIIGMTRSFGNGGDDVLVLKYDLNGNLLKEVYWGGSNYEEAFEAIIDRGYLYLTGFTFSFGNDRQLFVLKMDLNGNVIWYSIWGGADKEQGYGIDVLNDDIFVSGYTYSLDGDMDVVVLRYSTNGTLLGELYWGGSGSDLPFGLTAHNGYIYVTGWTTSYGNGEQLFLLKIEGNFSDFVIGSPSNQSTGSADNTGGETSSSGGNESPPPEISSPKLNLNNWLTLIIGVVLITIGFGLALMMRTKHKPHEREYVIKPPMKPIKKRVLEESEFVDLDEIREKLIDLLGHKDFDE